MRVLRSSNDDEMVWLFLRGELDSERFGPGILRAIDERRRAALTTVRGYERREGTASSSSRTSSRRRECRRGPLPAQVVREAMEEVVGDAEDRHAGANLRRYWVELSGGSRLPGEAAAFGARGAAGPLAADRRVVVLVSQPRPR
ncbi:MAG: hypothetical protein MSC30_15930, partial [Gaiellaceae bacterium MAG52_C11]|nr:hypothetical protein [Candidatus Gaiellasilicea maunaloa]